MKQDWEIWEELIRNAFIDIGFDVEKRKLKEINKEFTFNIERDGLGCHKSFPNFIVDIECKKWNEKIDYDIINNSFGIKDSLEKKGFIVNSVVASYLGFTDRAKEIAKEKKILLISKEDKEILQKIKDDLNQLKYHYILKIRQKRVPNITGSNDFNLFDRLNEMIKIYDFIEQNNPPITIKKILEEVKKNSRFVETHPQIKNEGKFTFAGDYKLLFRRILKIIRQEKKGNKIEIYITEAGRNFMKMDHNDQVVFFLLKLLRYEGFRNYLELKSNANHLLSELNNYVEVRVFNSWLQYFGIDNQPKQTLEVLFSCAKILIEIDRLQLYDDVYSEIENSIVKIIKKII